MSYVFFTFNCKIKTEENSKQYNVKRKIDAIYHEQNLKDSSLHKIYAPERCDIIWQKLVRFFRLNCSEKEMNC